MLSLRRGVHAPSMVVLFAIKNYNGQSAFRYPIHQAISRIESGVDVPVIEYHRHARMNLGPTWLKFIRDPQIYSYHTRNACSMVVLRLWLHVTCEYVVQRPAIQKFVAVARAIGEHVGQADSYSNFPVCWGCTCSSWSISS